MSANSVMNVPNSLTLLRILLIPVFVSLLGDERFDAALVVLLIAGLTDGLDGVVARVTNQQTRIGAYLDPLADKLLLTAGFVTLSLLHLVPVWVAIVIVGRDLLLMTATLLARWADQRVDISPTVWGKATTLLQLSYLFLVVAFASRRMELQALAPLLYLMVGVTAFSGGHYLYRYLFRGTTHATA
ncbi:MAG: CDP-alcohol phosphatidyltransferase family protein [Nitrospirota bacterium]|nr:CDP-alcohol phosphatidyltransferase family protein [Nitrospirota bacterium]MDE3036304.1 CDP-alcohol phosphatidyltransferase family protein [Nitrospirota bacterium]MDE3226327.1 CDP-alcohol phosphatidyltransferase family protein [Nitrospirota bacterium]MDE3242725.1 CDP-alcohol phosphatidyltransferase family protein [Nitrospirota bacterium]